MFAFLQYVPDILISPYIEYYLQGCGYVRNILNATPPGYVICSIKPQICDMFASRNGRNAGCVIYVINVDLDCYCLYFTVSPLFLQFSKS